MLLNEQTFDWSSVECEKEPKIAFFTWICHEYAVEADSRFVEEGVREGVCVCLLVRERERERERECVCLCVRERERERERES